MFACGEQSAHGFRLKDGTYSEDNGASKDLVSFIDLKCPVRHLCVGRRLLSYVNTDGNAFIIRINPSKDGAWKRGKQKHVDSKVNFQGVSCTQDTLYLLSTEGQVLCVQAHAPLRPFEPFRGMTVCQVSCGSHHCLALTKDGRVFSWGVDSRGQLGVGKKGSKPSSPQPVRSVSELAVVQVAAGGEQSFCLTVSGGVWSWGSNSCGQLGLGDSEDRNTPHQLKNLNMKKACHISCGEAHTAVLTKEGAVYTFGSGKHGQLGHNSFKDELRPRLVAELWGSEITALACGKHHSVFLSRSNLYLCGVQNQTLEGRREVSAAVPLLVPMLYEHLDGGTIRQIFAGEHCFYATISKQENEEPFKNKLTVFDSSLSDLITVWTSDTQSWSNTKRQISRTFSSVANLNQSFLDHRRHFETSSKQCGLDLCAAQSSFSKLLQRPSLMKEVERACESLLRSLTTCPVEVECLRVYLLLTELLHVLHQLQRGRILVEMLAVAILGLPKENIIVLEEWWSTFPDDIRMRHTSVWKNAAPHASSLDSSRSLLQVLQLLYNKNKSLSLNRIPDSAFNTPVSLMMLTDMCLWKLDPIYRVKMVEKPILCSFPFLMDLTTRLQALKISSYYIQLKKSMPWPWPEWDLGEEYIEEFFTFLIPRFTLRLRREHVMEDTITQLSLADHNHFRRPLQIFFNGVEVNDNVNRKDFFHLVFHRLVSAESGMFMFNDSSTLAWFSSRATLPLDYYFLFGVLCGLAVFHSHRVFLPFPLVLFKKLLGVAPSLDDLYQFSPCTGRSLRCLLEEYTEDVIQSLDQDFTIYWDQVEVALDIENPDRPVTTQNKEEFVMAYLTHVFTTSVKSQFEEFSRGFFSSTERQMVELFSPEELRDILVGQELSDWTRFKQSAKYEGDYHPSHPTIQMFWEVFDELTEEQRKALLWFITGFETLPILTLDLVIKICVLSIKDENMSEDQYYPQSHTCINVLELPQYSSKELMKHRLIEALKQVDPW